jgi:hypothetical protein
MNPFHWKHEHQIAWAIKSVVGAFLSLMLGFMHLPSFTLGQPWQVFDAWLSSPESYWPWPLLGFLITGVIFYGIIPLTHGA